MKSVIVIGLLASLPALACDHHRVEESDSDEFEFKTGSGSAPPRIEVRIDDGSVEVERSGTDGVVEITFRKRARAADRSSALSLLESLRAEAVQDGETIRVRARGGLGNVISFGGSLRTDVSLRVPKEAELDIRTKDGRIEIEGVSGAIDAETGDGRIRLSRVHGDVKLRTWDGSVIATDVAGDFDIASDDGRIQLEGRFGALRAVTADGSIRIESREPAESTGDWHIRTSDGSIELTLSDSFSAELEASSNDGRIVNELSKFQGTTREGRVKGTLGSGGARIRITTMDGRITLREM